MTILIASLSLCACQRTAATADRLQKRQSIFPQSESSESTWRKTCDFHFTCARTQSWPACLCFSLMLINIAYKRWRHIVEVTVAYVFALWDFWGLLWIRLRVHSNFNKSYCLNRVSCLKLQVPLMQGAVITEQTPGYRLQICCILRWKVMTMDHRSL